MAREQDRSNDTGRDGPVEPAGSAGDETRREALKRFGRYAAVAPTAMLLLSPRSGQAHHKAGHHIPPGWLKNGKAGDGGYG